MKVDATRRDDGHAGAHRRDRGKPQRVGRVRVHQIDAAISDHPAKTHRRSYVSLESRRAGHDLQASGTGPLREQLAGTRRDDRDVATTSQLRRQPQCLTLATSPTTLRIDVKNAHLI